MVSFILKGTDSVLKNLLILFNNLEKKFMKKNLVFPLLLTLATASFSQPTTTVVPTIKTDYLQKSKNQKKIALAFGVPGVALFTIGGIMYISEFGNGLLPGQTEQSKNNSKTGEVLMIAGGVLCIVALPFQVASTKNKLKALSLSFRNEKAAMVQKSGFVNRCVPSLTLKISL